MRLRAPRRACLLGGAASALATGLLAATLLAGGAAPAGAHATLIGTVPAADGVVDAVPAAVELRFDEPVELVDDAVQVFGPDGDRVDQGTVETRDAGATLVAPIGGDAQGTYTVAWRVTSEDSHTLSGSFVFHNGTRTGAVDVDDGNSTATDIFGGVARWLGFAGTMTAIGAAAVALLLPRPASGRRQDRRRRRRVGRPHRPHRSRSARRAGRWARHAGDGMGAGGATATLTAPAPAGDGARRGRRATPAPCCGCSRPGAPSSGRSAPSSLSSPSSPRAPGATCTTPSPSSPTWPPTPAPASSPCSAWP